jgi:hypothetical protein
LAMWAQLSDRPHQAHTLRMISGARIGSGQVKESTESAQKALDLWTAEGDRSGIADALDQMAAVSLLNGNLKLAEDYGARAVRTSSYLILYRWRNFLPSVPAGPSRLAQVFRVAPSQTSPPSMHVWLTAAVEEADRRPRHPRPCCLRLHRREAAAGHGPASCSSKCQPPPPPGFPASPCISPPSQSGPPRADAGKE